MHDDDIDPSPQGLLRCLQVLSEEAACLSLTRTFAALQDAIAACRDESRPSPSGWHDPLCAGIVH